MMQKTIDFAARLQGREYGDEMALGEDEEARALGLVVVLGGSDDLIEFRGAISDERGVFNGGDVFLDRLGIVPTRQECHTDEQLRDYFERQPRAAMIRAIWCAHPDGPRWTYQTPGIPHASFDILEDGHVYCRGVVFELTDLPAVLLGNGVDRG